ncbi:hypothetical protein ACFWOJ_04765 [Streptomyces sp. NPDC058439]|uniref:hypothetical protein n=1 Tax=Streptomyces sp. NPDC058439 TaxID=3346500 RepID=UPI003653A9C0
MAHQKVTVRQLLNHTSGIPSVGSGGDNHGYQVFAGAVGDESCATCRCGGDGVLGGG